VLLFAGCSKQHGTEPCAPSLLPFNIKYLLPELFAAEAVHLYSPENTKQQSTQLREGSCFVPVSNTCERGLEVRAMASYFNPRYLLLDALLVHN
jgi:hypothetical protein